ncbi:hypothetical protein GYMLUDRAFT_99455 [Collybiopsis luxurians FD-317 M1]|uniref:Uncharacterized protein n=1 Tax=Collybiopsis luxurians FD-317 M1 TaxID=944289 RepID=A0A0D0BLL4_9AGAR|nr:hypothetical protein GYMLUDRAFT_99455 [Collybiopsis luxurians FD-317 M1]
MPGRPGAETEQQTIIEKDDQEADTTQRFNWLTVKVRCVSFYSSPIQRTSTLMDEHKAKHRFMSEPSRHGIKRSVLTLFNSRERFRYLSNCAPKFISNSDNELILVVMVAHLERWIFHESQLSSTVHIIMVCKIVLTWVHADSSKIISSRRLLLTSVPFS